MLRRFLTPAALFTLALAVGSAKSATLDFQLLGWDDSTATKDLPSAVGRKPSATMPTAGDWLVFTADDEVLAAGNNATGAFSHNLVDITGAGGRGFNLAPSLAGTLTLVLAASGGSNWTVTVTALSYSGQANAQQAMNQYLVSPGDPATSNTSFNVDGSGNSGQWTASATANWAIQFTLDFYLATSADGDPRPADVDATFDDKLQQGFLLPVSQITTHGLSGVSLEDPLGFYTGDFEQYLLYEIKPRLPADATYLLITQMVKTHPGYAELGLPITRNSLIGNTTIAYTTDTLAAAPQIVSLRFENAHPGTAFHRGGGPDVCA